MVVTQLVLFHISCPASRPCNCLVWELCWSNYHAGGIYHIRVLGDDIHANSTCMQALSQSHWTSPLVLPTPQCTCMHMHTFKGKLHSCLHMHTHTHAHTHGHTHTHTNTHTHTHTHNKGGESNSLIGCGLCWPQRIQ